MASSFCLYVFCWLVAVPLEYICIDMDSSVFECMHVSTWLK